MKGEIGAKERETQVAVVEAAKAVALREAALQREVKKMNAQTRTEKLKAEYLSKASMEYETKADLYKKMKDAEAQKASAEAAFFAKQQAAYAEVYANRNEAEGLVALAHAQGVYLATLLRAFGRNYAALRDYLTIEHGMFQQIAKTNAEAIRGLQPKISVWNTEGGSNSNGPGNTALKEVAGVYSMLSPLFKTVQEQTGILPPAWMWSLAGDQST
ncbi:hypothetical protein CRG98_004317 [Punica granatum]|uniref:Flotillin-like n=1 Tax=Punica granatum TaxID=22663 RepID=A0A2I0L3J9_PUNGR|nr:hypothetical protein CRG98_004317 [Punica granatum]